MPQDPDSPSFPDPPARLALCLRRVRLHLQRSPDLRLRVWPQRLTVTKKPLAPFPETSG